MLLVIALTALAAPLIAPQNPYDLKQLFLDKAELPPIWLRDGEWPFLLGTDPQGRDVLSAILYGSRISLVIGLPSVLLAMADRRHASGLVAGFLGGRVDNLLMRLGDTVLSIPTLLVAILVSAIFRELLPPALREPFAAGDPGAVDRADRLGAVRPHRARLDHGRAAQGIRAGRADHRRAGRAASCAGTSCPTR